MLWEAVRFTPSFCITGLLSPRESHLLTSLRPRGSRRHREVVGSVGRSGSEGPWVGLDGGILVSIFWRAGRGRGRREVGAECAVSWRRRGGGGSGTVGGGGRHDEDMAR